jgi:hypothetical protein
VANAGLAERVDRLAWGRSGRPARRPAPWGGRGGPSSPGDARPPPPPPAIDERATPPTEGTEGRARRRTSWAARAAAPPSTTSTHKTMSAHATWNSRPAAGSAPEWASCFAQSRALGTPGPGQCGYSRAGRRDRGLGVSQFFDSNPAARSPQGPKRARGVGACHWRAALGLPDAPHEPREGATGELQAPPRVSPAPSDVVEESSKQSLPSSDPPSRGPGLV